MPLRGACCVPGSFDVEAVFLVLRAGKLARDLRVRKIANPDIVMARYKLVDRSPKFIPVVLDAQIQPGNHSQNPMSGLER
jgi:hypothetical protein